MSLDAKIRNSVGKRYRSTKKSTPDDIQRSVARSIFLSKLGPVPELGVVIKANTGEPMLNLTIHIDHQRNGREIESNIVEGTRRIITNVLSAHGYGGVWRLVPIVRQPLNTREFWAKSITQHGKQFGIKIWTAVSNSRDGAWELSLYPPPNYDVNDVFASISNKPTVPVATPIVAQATPPVYVPPPPPSAIKFVGHVFAGTAISVSKTKCQIELYPDVVGTLSNTDWDHKPCADLTLVVKDGEEVKVMVVDETLKLSRVAAFEAGLTHVDVLQSFTETPNTNGQLSLARFIDDPKRINYLLETMAECYPETKGTANYGHYVPREMLCDAWSAALKKRYNAKTLTSLGPIFAALTRRGVIAPFPKDTDHLSRLGYYLTDSGWRCVGGPETVEVDPKIIMDFLDEVSPTSKSFTNWPLPASTTPAEPPLAKPIEPVRTEPPVNNWLTPMHNLQQENILVEYVEKQKALTAIADQIIILQAQHDELVTWLDENAGVGQQVQRLRTLLLQ